MKPLRMIAMRIAFVACASLGGACNAQSLAEVRKEIADYLLYPRDARYSMRATLPSDSVDAGRNSQWAAVGEQLSKAGLVRSRRVAGKTVLDPTEQSLDVVVPSTNLRYETTALNVVLGRWEIEVLRLSRTGDVTVVYGKRHLAKRTRAYGLIVQAIPAEEAAEYADRDAVWEISGRGASLRIVETIK